MRYIDKFINYFLSSFLNNSKNYNYMSSLLKLFFERNNKTRTTITNLGDVFRNSKWSDFKIQNTKTNFISQYTYSLLLTFLLVLCIFYFTNIFKVHNIFNNWNINSLLIDTYNNYAYSIGAMYFSLYTSIKFFFIKKIDLNTYELFKPYNNMLSKNNNLFNTKMSNTLRFDNNEPIWNFTKTFYSLTLQNELFLNSNRINNYLYNNENFRCEDKTLINSISDLNQQYDILNIKQINIKDTHYMILTPLMLNKDVLLYNTFATDNNLNISRQERWLMKNTPVSRNISTNNHSILESKKLISNNFLKNNITNINIWASNFFNNSNFDAFKNATKLNNNNKNYNFHEESIEFFTKRFIFLVDQPHLKITKNIKFINNSQKQPLLNLYELDTNFLKTSTKQLNTLNLNLNSLSTNSTNYRNLNNTNSLNDYVIKTIDNEILNNEYGLTFQILQNTNNTQKYTLNHNTLIYKLK